MASYRFRLARFASIRINAEPVYVMGAVQKKLLVTVVLSGFNYLSVPADGIGLGPYLCGVFARLTKKRGRREV